MGKKITLFGQKITLFWAKCVQRKADLFEVRKTGAEVGAAAARAFDLFVGNCLRFATNPNIDFIATESVSIPPSSMIP